VKKGCQRDEWKKRGIVAGELEPDEKKKRNETNRTSPASSHDLQPPPLTFSILPTLSNLY